MASPNVTMDSKSHIMRWPSISVVPAVHRNFAFRRSGETIIYLPLWVEISACSISFQVNVSGGAVFLTNNS